MPRKDAPAPGTISAQAQQSLVSEGIDKYELPKSIITRIAKSALPETAKLQKDTVLSLVKGSTVFINYLAATAHEVAESKQHKTILAADVIRALEMIEFGDMTEQLNNELNVYRNVNKGDKTKKESSIPASASAGPVSATVPSIKVKGKSKAKDVDMESANGTAKRAGKTVPPQYLQKDVLDTDSEPDVDADDALIPRLDDDDDDDPMTAT